MKTPQSKIRALVVLALLALTFLCPAQRGLRSPAFVANLHPAAAAAGSDITDSMRVWLKLDDGSGTSAVDSSGNAHTGTLEGTTPPTWVAGSKNGALDFADATSSVNLGGNLLGTGDKSITFLLYADTYPGSVAYICGETKFTIYVGNTGLLLVSGDSGGTTASGATFFGTSGYVFVCVTVTSAGTCNIYRNGVLDGSANQATGTPSTTAFPFTLGAGAFTGSSVDARIDEFRVYDRILSSAEALQLKNYYLP